MVEKPDPKWMHLSGRAKARGTKGGKERRRGERRKEERRERTPVLNGGDEAMLVKHDPSGPPRIPDQEDSRRKRRAPDVVHSEVEFPHPLIAKNSDEVVNFHHSDL